MVNRQHSWCSSKIICSPANRNSAILCIFFSIRNPQSEFYNRKPRIPGYSSEFALKKTKELPEFTENEIRAVTWIAQHHLPPFWLGRLAEKSPRIINGKIRFKFQPFTFMQMDINQRANIHSVRHAWIWMFVFLKIESCGKSKIVNGAVY